MALCHTVDRKVKTNDEWTVLLETAMPAVLVELAFLTNDAERARLTSDMGNGNSPKDWCAASTASPMVGRCSAK